MKNQLSQWKQLIRKDYRWLTPILTGLTLFYVLYIFQGYNIQKGFSYSGHSFLVRTLCFGLLTALIFFLYEYPVTKWLQLQSRRSRVAGYLITVLAGAIATFLLFNVFWNWTEWTWPAFGLIIMEYSFVMIIPLGVIALLTKNRRESVRLTGEKLQFTSENEKDSLYVSPKDFLVAQSAGNYVEIFYRSKGELKKHLIRNSLKRIEELYSDHPMIRRCHRSFLINPANIQTIRAQGGKLEFDLGLLTVPVSAKYKESFIPYIQNSSQK